MIEFTENFYLEKIWNKELLEINGDKEEPAWVFVLKYLKSYAIKGYVYTRKEIVENIAKENDISKKTIYKALKKLLKERKLLMQINPVFPKFLIPTSLTEEDLFTIRRTYIDSLKETTGYLRQIYFDTKENMLIYYKKLKEENSYLRQTHEDLLIRYNDIMKDLEQRQ